MIQDKFFGDMFGRGSSVWLKIIGAALATPVCLVLAMGRYRRRHGEIDLSSSTMVAILAGSVVVGALLGGLLAAKDVVVERMEAGRPVPPPLKLLLGYGAWSLMIWFFLAIPATLIVTLLTLGL